MFYGGVSLFMAPFCGMQMAARATPYRAHTPGMAAAKRDMLICEPPFALDDATIRAIYSDDSAISRFRAEQNYARSSTVNGDI